MCNRAAIRELRERAAALDGDGEAVQRAVVSRNAASLIRRGRELARAAAELFGQALDHHVDTAGDDAIERADRL